MNSPTALTQDALTHLDEERARSLLRQVRDFRREWATFAVRSQALFEAMRDQGAALPQEFLDAYQKLEQQKRQLVQELHAVTAGIPSEVWQQPQPEQSLADIEDRMSQLVQVAQQAATEIRQQVQQVDVIAQTLRSLQATDDSVGMELQQLADEVRTTVNRIESDPRVLLDASVAQQVAGWTALVALILDSTGGAPQAPLDALECEEHFDTVSRQVSLRIALAAVRGQLQPDREAIPVLTEVLAADHRALSAPSPAKVAQLVERFGGGHTTPLTERTIDVPAPAPSRPDSLASAPVSLEELQATTDRLLELASELAPPEQEESTPPTTSQVRAAGYRNLAHTLQLVLTIIQTRGTHIRMYRGELHEALKLLAEAQNAVRVEHAAATGDDRAMPEQNAAFLWLRYITSEDVEAFPINRYMRRSEEADPQNFPDLHRRIHALGQRWKKARRAEAILAELPEVVAQLSSDQAEAAWKSLDQRVVEFLRCDRSEHDDQLLTALAPLPAALPDAGVPTDLLSSATAGVLNSVLARAEEREAEEREADKATTATAPDVVHQARKLLTGKVLAIVGGVPNPEAAERFKHDLHLKDVIWVPASKTDRVSDLRSAITSADVVVLVTKLIGHKHNDLRTACDGLGIPWVQTKRNAGYGVNQIASVVVEQASIQLSRSGSRKPDQQT